MPASPEQVQKLCHAAGVDEIAALSALERQDGDLLEALLDLEHSGLAPVPQGNGCYSTQRSSADACESPSSGFSAQSGSSATERSSGFSAHVTADALRDLARRSVENHLAIYRSGQKITSVPLLILLLLLVFFFLLTAAILAGGLILGFRYRFGGPDLNRDSLNRVLDRAAAFVQDLKSKVTDYFHHK